MLVFNGVSGKGVPGGAAEGAVLRAWAGFQTQTRRSGGLTCSFLCPRPSGPPAWPGEEMEETELRGGSLDLM